MSDGGDQSEFFTKLEEWGEDEVTILIATDRIAGRKKRVANEWLRRKAEERANRIKNEQMEIARSAAASAHDAAESARATVREAQAANKIAARANTIAVAAIIAAAISAIISLAT